MTPEQERKIDDLLLRRVEKIEYRVSLVYGQAVIKPEMLARVVATA